MLLYFIRHGDPIYTPDSLTEQGTKQADALAKRLVKSKINKIYSSTSNRSVLTAKPTCNLLNIEPTLLDWCNEKYSYEEFTGYNSENKRYFLMDCDNYRKLFVSKRIRDLQFNWYEDESFADMKCKSGMERILTKTEDFLEELGYKHNRENCTYTAVNPNDDRVALFAHAGFGSVFLSCLLDIPYPIFATRFGMGHSNITVVEFRERNIVVPRVLTFSNDSHLYKEELPTKWCNKIEI